MMQFSEISKIFDELIVEFQNLKAEVVVAEVEENSNLNITDLSIRNSSSFRRSFRRDIIKVEPITSFEPTLKLLLSRNGLYDRLPEGLFHKVIPDAHIQSGTELSKVLKKEEEEARSFFDPLENEFFYQKLQIEKNERVLLDDFYGLKDQFLLDFWKLDRDIPEEYLLKLVRLLPNCSKISGDIELARMCLERMLDIEVEFEVVYEEKRIDKNLKEDVTDNNMVGVNMVLQGEQIGVLQPKLDVTIGPLSLERAQFFQNNSGMLKFLETYYCYFVPMELEVSTDYKVEVVHGFELSESGKPVMGMSTAI